MILSDGVKHFQLQFLIGIDQLVNTCIPAPYEGTGFADETISARAWRLRKSKSSFFWQNAYKVIDCIFFWEKHHTLNAYLSEFAREQFPSHYQGEPNDEEN